MPAANWCATTGNRGATTGSPNLAAAAVAAEALGTVHHGFASTPMFMLARRIKAKGVKMVLSGEGSDEIFGGYLH